MEEWVEQRCWELALVEGLAVLNIIPVRRSIWGQWTLSFAFAVIVEWRDGQSSVNW